MGVVSSLGEGGAEFMLVWTINLNKSYDYFLCSITGRNYSTHMVKWLVAVQIHFNPLLELSLRIYPKKSKPTARLSCSYGGCIIFRHISIFG